MLNSAFTCIVRCGLCKGLLQVKKNTEEGNARTPLVLTLSIGVKIRRVVEEMNETSLLGDECSHHFETVLWSLNLLEFLY